MNISRSESADRSQRTREPEAPAKPRPPQPAPNEQVATFRALYAQHQRDALVADQPKGGADHYRWRSVEAQVRKFDEGAGSMTPVDVSGALHAQRVCAESMPAAPTAANVAPALSELIERHVRQLLVSEGGIRGESGEVMLRLSEDTLPGTDLRLSKGADGWLLRAEVRSLSAYEALQRCADQLGARFAERNLGQLRLETVLHDA